MVRRPRMTFFMQRKLSEIAEELRSMMQDDVIYDAYMNTLRVYTQLLQSTRDMQFPVDHEQSQLLWTKTARQRALCDANLDLLIAIIRERSPEVVHRWDDEENHLKKMVLTSLFFHCGIDLSPEGDNQIPEWVRMARLSQNNPIMRLMENVYYIPEDASEFGDANHRYACLQELDGYLTAIQESQKRGRPRKESTQKPAAKQQRIPPEKALEAHAMRENGESYLSIAQHFFPTEYNLADPHQKNQARGRAKNWVERGYLIKHPPTSQN